MESFVKMWLLDFILSKYSDLSSLFWAQAPSWKQDHHQNNNNILNIFSDNTYFLESIFCCWIMIKEVLHQLL